MLIRVDPQSSEPIFEQIAFQVKDAVARGALVTGDRLPSVRQLARDLTVNPNTVVRSYELLERDGVIVRRQGIGVLRNRARPASCPTGPAGGPRRSHAAHGHGGVPPRLRWSGPGTRPRAGPSALCGFRRESHHERSRPRLRRRPPTPSTDTVHRHRPPTQDLADLTTGGSWLSDATAPNLEDLFIDLTTSDDEVSLLPEPQEISA